MTNAWNGPPDRAGWYAQANPGDTTADPDKEHLATREWEQTHPTLLRRLIVRLRRH